MKQLDLFQDSEIWVNIAEYGDKYQICNIGEKVRNKKGKILYTQIHSNKYYMVQLCKNGKMKLHTVHRLKAIAFVPNFDNLPCVNHKDENRTNNNISNLEWCTSKHNNRESFINTVKKGLKRNYNQRFVLEEILKIRQDFNNGIKIGQMARNYDTKYDTIANIVKRKTWNYDGI